MHTISENQLKDSWLCRDYRRGDERQILNLYEEVNGRKMAPEYWRWWYIENPSGRGIIKLLFDGGKLIGQYAVAPVNLIVDGRPRKAVFSLHTMTHPDFQKQGIMTFLAEEVYKKCQSEGFKLVYGFPNENIYHTRITRLGWTGFGKMRSWEKELDVKSRVPPKARNVFAVSRFDEEVDTLWEKVKPESCVIVPRTGEYLNWRFTRHPLIEYPKYVITAGGGELSGYMVLKVYRDGELVKGHIVDILTIEHAPVVRGLLDSAYRHFIKKRIDNLSCWAPEKAFCTKILEEEGFVNKEFDVNFGVRTFDKTDESLKSVGRLENWHLMMGDIDVV